MKVCAKIGVQHHRILKCELWLSFNVEGDTGLEIYHRLSNVYRCLAGHMTMHVYRCLAGRMTMHVYRCLVGRMTMHASQIGPTDTAPHCPGSPLRACVETSNVYGACNVKSLRHVYKWIKHFMEETCRAWSPSSS